VAVAPFETLCPDGVWGGAKSRPSLIAMGAPDAVPVSGRGTATPSS